MDQSWQQRLESAARVVSRWLSFNSTLFRESLDQHGGIDAVLQHLDSAVAHSGHENDQYLFFQIEEAGVIVGAGFFETNGQYVLLHSMGLSDSDRRRGIGSRALAWYLASLPEESIDATCLAGVHLDNLAMRAWCARFGGAEEPIDDTALVSAFSVGDACEQLSGPYPGDLQPAFPRNWQGLTFRLLYLGRHPQYLAPGEEPICE